VAKAGLQAGDKIVKMDDVPMPTALAVVKHLRLRYAEETLSVVFLREGAEQTVTLTVERRDAR
jgi:S1-C subfamily serine protease